MAKSVWREVGDMCRSCRHVFNGGALIYGRAVAGPDGIGTGRVPIGTSKPARKNIGAERERWSRSRSFCQTPMEGAHKQQRQLTDMLVGDNVERPPRRDGVRSMVQLQLVGTARASRQHVRGMACPT